MNTRTIQPVDFWTPEGVKVATTLLLYNFHGYNFDGTDSVVSYKLLSATDESLSEGSVALPDDVVQVWGANDAPIFDYVLTQLNLTEV
jgi:hypothetical protein